MLLKTTAHVWNLPLSVSKDAECRSQWPCGLRRGFWPVGCWDRGFESRSRHGCLSASFCVVLPCAGKRPCHGQITRPGSPTMCLNSSRNLLYVRRPRSFKDCRATKKKGCWVQFYVKTPSVDPILLVYIKRCRFTRVIKHTMKVLFCIIKWIKSFILLFTEMWRLKYTKL
jgi:hypothetical protein